MAPSLYEAKVGFVAEYGNDQLDHSEVHELSDYELDGLSYTEGWAPMSASFHLGKR